MLNNRFRFNPFALLLRPEGDGGQSNPGGTPGGESAPPQGGGNDTPPAGVTPPPAGSQNSATPWTDAIADADLKAFATERGFKDPGEALKALRETETKFAVPAKPEDYAIEVPQGQDGAFAKTAAGWFHKHGIPAAAANGLAADWNAFVAAQQQATDTAQQQKGEQELGALRGEWGQQYEGNIELGRRAMRTFGVPAELIDSLAGKMGDAQTLRLFHNIGKAMSEGTLNPGTPAGGGNGQPAVGDPDAARAARMFPSMAKK